MGGVRVAISLVPTWARTVAAVLLALVMMAGAAPRALADGDPGSDVLVYQSLFAESDAGLWWPSSPSSGRC